MKYILFFLFFSPFALLAQDCALKKGKDIITSKPTLSTGFMDLQGNTLSIDVNSKEIDFFFVLNHPSVKCLNEETEISFMLEGGKIKPEFRNSGSLNCDGVFHVIFKNSAYTPSQLTRLGSKKIVAIQLTGSSAKPYIITLSPDQQQQLMNQISCVIKEAKTVL